MLFVVRGPLHYSQDLLAAWYEDAGRDLSTLLRTIGILSFVGEVVCYGIVGYWMYRFFLAI